VKGTTNRTTRVGHSAAWMGVAIAIAAAIARAAERMLFIDSYPIMRLMASAAPMAWARLSASHQPQRARVR
jgi:hypothetical protein